MDPASAAPARRFEQLMVHQFDPAEHIAGGVHGFIADLVRLAPEHHTIRLIGVDATGGRRLGRWVDAVVGGRTISFLPVARLSAGQRRRVPHTLRLMAGLLVRRPPAHGAVIHAHRSETVVILSLLYPRSTIVNFVQTDAEEALRHRAETLWRFLPAVHRAFEKLAVKRAARTWVFSAEAAARLALVSPTVRPANHFFDGDLFHPPDVVGERRPATFGWVGRLEASKDPLKAVEVLGELSRRGVVFEAWLAGDGTLAEAVAARVDELGLADRVRLCGTLTPAEVGDLLRRTDVVLLTSLWEGQPRALLEALGSGVPVVSTPVGDVPAIVVEGATGFVARSGSVAELADLAVRALDLRDRTAIAATVSQHRARDVVAAFFADFESLVGSNGRVEAS